TSDGLLRDFAVKVVWDLIRLRVMLCKLKAQAKLWQWDVGESVHLFFECPFSLKALKIAVQRLGFHMGPLELNDVTSWLIPMSSKRSLKSVFIIGNEDTIAFVRVLFSIYNKWLDRDG
nr:hypothetical protein [Tanacetum cinerariifolium]